MLRIKTYVSHSSIHGLGLFADEFIKKGRIVWEYFPEIDITFSSEKWRVLSNSLDPHSRAVIEKLSYKEGDKHIVCIDNAQYMNHHETKFNIGNSDDLKSMLSLYDIDKDSELFCNYFESFDPDDIHYLKLKK